MHSQNNVRSLFYHFLIDETLANGTVSSKFFNVTECADGRNFVCQMPAFLQVFLDLREIAEK